jgi:hypothetical protein
VRVIGCYSKGAMGWGPIMSSDTEFWLMIYGDTQGQRVPKGGDPGGGGDTLPAGGEDPREGTHPRQWPGGLAPCIKCYGLPSPNSSRSDQPALPLMDYMRIGVIPGCSAILQNLRKPEIQAALQELVAARSQRTRITGSSARGTLWGKPLRKYEL